MRHRPILPTRLAKTQAKKRYFRRNNRKPQRRNQRGHAPWVKVLHAQAGLAPQAAALLHAVQGCLPDPSTLAAAPGAPWPIPNADPGTPPAARIYADWLQRLRILQRFPQPDWSIADKWIAKELLRRGMPAPQAAAILRAGSPGFPRRHSHPDDYLRRTLARAVSELQAPAFPRREGALPTW